MSEEPVMRNLRPRKRPSLIRNTSNPELSKDSIDFIAHESSQDKSNSINDQEGNLSDQEASDSDGSISEDLSPDESDEKSEQVLNTTENNKKKQTENHFRRFTCNHIITIVVGSLFLLGSPMLFAATYEAFPSVTPDCNNNINVIQEKFPNQSSSLWLVFESGTNDVVEQKRPSTFIFLYKTGTEDTLTRLVEELAEYAACVITDRAKKPIVLTNAILKSPEVLEDYGVLIERYKEELKDQGVMIVENLENVPGVSAQAFHSFCDQYTPLVEKSLFIFTMRVDKLHGKDRSRFVDKFLKDKWTDIKVDTFNALITRINNMVIEIVP